MPVDVTENYIRVRVKDPDLFQEDSFRTIDISEDEGIKAVIGKLEGETKTTVQAYLFDKEKWDKERAVAWVEEHKSKKAIKSLDDPWLTVIDQEYIKFAGSPKNRFGTHSSAGFKGNYAAAWRCHFFKLRDTGPIQGTVRRCEMIAATMKPSCNLPTTEVIGASSKPSEGCTFPNSPSDYGLSHWEKPEGEGDREKMALSCKDLAIIKRAALGEIKRRAKEREARENKKAIIPANIKAIGDWELDVLGVPFGSPLQRDAHGQYFDASTDLHLESYPTPTVHYYHGFAPDGHPQGDPVEIGKIKSTEVRNDGVWYRIILDKAQEFARRVMEAAKKNLARASSGTANHLVRVSQDGHITNWPVIELSLFDIDRSAGRVPANNYAVAIPVMKALFERAGIAYPDNLPDENEPETKAKGEQHRAKVEQRTLQVQAKAKLFLLETDDGP